MLAGRFGAAYERAHPGDTIVRVDLARMELGPQTPEVLREQDALWKEGSWTTPCLTWRTSLRRRTKS